MRELLLKPQAHAIGFSVCEAETMLLTAFMYAAMSCGSGLSRASRQALTPNAQSKYTSPR